MDTYLKRVKEHTPLLDKVGDVYAMVDDNRKLITQELLAAESILYLPGMALTRNLCNLDPSGYHQVFLHYFLLLLDHFDLSFAEMIGVQSTMEHMHFTSLFFVLSAKTLLACLPRGKYQSETAGYYGLGHLLLKLMPEYHGLYRNRRKYCLI